jgi:(2Fe-2S) ferredoxin
MAVYPEGAWYHHVTPEKMEQILKQHIVGNQPVKEYLLYQLDASSGTVITRRPEGPTK